MSSTRSPLLSRLLAPECIVVVGGQSAATVIAQCQRIGYAGDIHAVHPTRSELAGIACVTSLDALPVSPDACFIGVSPENTVDAVAALAAKGAGGAVCYASGFAEAGTQGGLLQQKLVQCAGAMPLVGPNCHGFINYLDGVALWPDHFGGGRTQSGPALLMQSGNIGINVTFQQRGLAFSYVVAMGNNAQLGVHDYIHAMLDDSRVTAIGLHLEGIGNVAEFSKAALRALHQRIPLVALKSGSSVLGAQMALSHTRSLANPDDLVSVMLERYGVARCTSLPEFLETLKFVATGGAIPFGKAGVLHPRIASLSCSGGEASHLADLVAASQVVLPQLSEQTRQALSKALGDKVHLSNPLDYHTYAWGDGPTLTEAFTALLREPLECALLILDYPPPELYDVSLWKVAEEALCVASEATGTRVVVVASLPENFPASARTRLLQRGLAPMQGLQECVQAIQHAAQTGRAQHMAESLMPIVVRGLDEEAAITLDELSGKQELAQHGLCVPKSARCCPLNAEEVASTIGFPLVMKALGNELAHKTEMGAVRLGIQTMSEVARHAKELGAFSDELLIEAMVDDAVAELLVGVTHNPDFGQVLVLGAGGTHVELLGDSVQLLLPATRQQLNDALMSLKHARLLTGFRGSCAADIEAALDAIMAICQYAIDNQDDLLELDVNPLLVRPAHRPRKIEEDAGQRTTNSPDHSAGIANGPGAIAVDVLLRKRG